MNRAMCAASLSESNGSSIEIIVKEVLLENKMILFCLYIVEASKEHKVCDSEHVECHVHHLNQNVLYLERHKEYALAASMGYV